MTRLISLSWCHKSINVLCSTPSYPVLCVAASIWLAWYFNGSSNRVESPVRTQCLVLTTQPDSWLT